MSDRAAPMSSEPDMKAKIIEAAHDHWHSDPFPECHVLDELLDDYTTIIEQRVLAQQPCYGVWYSGRMICKKMDSDQIDWCPNCLARAAQTLETSG